MRILFDHQIFTFQDYGGISRIYVELYKNLKSTEQTKVDLPIVFSNNSYLEELVDIRPSQFLPETKSFLKKAVMKVVNDCRSAILLLQKDFDIFQPTYFDPYFLKFLGNKPFVLTIYDMTHERFPETVSAIDKTVAWKRKLAKRANRIIAISESTKNDIVKILGVSEDKIDVVYLATSLSKNLVSKVSGLPKNYLLFVGNRTGYKNFDTFLRAVAPVLLKNKDLHLICAGGGSFTEDELSILNSLNVGEKVHQIYFKDDRELAYIYSKAKCFIYPSKYEGFGIPVLEGFACGCPVLTSNVSSLPEVGGDAAFYFDPENVDSIKEAVEKILSDEGLRNDMIKKGRERLKSFSWEKTAEQYIDVYKKALNK